MCCTNLKLFSELWRYELIDGTRNLVMSNDVNINDIMCQYSIIFNHFVPEKKKHVILLGFLIMCVQLFNRIRFLAMLSLALLHVATVISLSSAKLPDLGEHHWLLKLLGADKSGNTAVRSPS